LNDRFRKNFCDGFLKIFLGGLAAMTDDEKKLLEQIYEMDKDVRELASSVKELKGDVKEFRNGVTDFSNEMKGFYSEFRNNQKEIVEGITRNGK